MAEQNINSNYLNSEAVANFMQSADFYDSHPIDKYQLRYYQIL